MSSCLVPAKRVWRGLRARLGLQPCRAGAAGLGRLRKEVRTCEYSDVHVMWEMLSNSNTTNASSGVKNGRRDTAGKGAAAATRRARAGRKAAAAVAAWSRLASYCCAL